MPKASKTAKNRFKRHARSESTEAKDSQTTVSPQLNVIDGHDYTDAQFEEIDPTFKDQVVPGLREVNTLALFALTARTGPGRKSTGPGWRDLLAVSTKWDKFIWPSMGDIAFLTTKFKTNDDCKFRVWFCPPGLLHIEVDDDGAWSVQDIVTLRIGCLRAEIRRKHD